MVQQRSAVDELFATLIERLELEPGFDVQRFLAQHPEQAPSLRARLERLRRVGLVGDARGESTLVAAMRERFGVHTELPAIPRPPAGTERSPAELLPSRVVGGRYRILAELGRGGMGRVFRALDLDLGREVALKVADLERLLPAADAAQRRAWIERFLTEAQVTAQLEHPSIVPVHDIGVDRAGQLYYTMKLVEGETLAAKIEQWHAACSAGAPLPIPELLRIVLQVCQAVAFAHERGVLHRDLKPSNVMVGRFGEVQVVDWGLAKLLARAEEVLPVAQRHPFGGSDSPTLAGEVLGTPTHMSPEQARGQPAAVGPAADVFGLGALLHHGLVGSPPNRGDSQPAAAATAPLPAELEAIRRRALHPRPEERYASALDLAKDLQAFLDGRVVRAHEAGTWAELRKWVRRNRLLVAAAGIALVALVGGLAASLVQRARAEQRAEEVLRLSALQDLAALIAESDELWPLVPETLPRLEDWIGRAQRLVLELPTHRSDLTRRSAEDSREARWWAEQLRTLVSGLEGMESGLLAPDALVPGHGWSVPKRKARLEEWITRFAPGGEFARAWEQAIPAIRARYEGLEVQPQFGLVPIGPDPASGLWEFAHLQTGGVAVRETNGRLRIGEETGLVLVLLPGGEFMMGAQAKDPSAPNYDEDAQPVEFPPNHVRLSPFLLSKHEMSQGQWLRLAGTNPSYYRGTDWVPGIRNIDLSNPVENVSWDDCRALESRYGLGLPSEAQWQYAARAGTSTPWWWGSEPSQMRFVGNIADQAMQAHGALSTMVYASWDDGHAAPAPCGSYLPNPFGFHDIVGNVAEWCCDGFADYPSGARSDPVLGLESSLRVLCGGAFNSSPSDARITHRGTNNRRHRNGNIGFRPVIRISSLP